MYTPPADFAKVMQHVQSVVNAIYNHESPDALQDMGLTVIQGAHVFDSPTTVQVNGDTIRAERTIVCTGSSPLILPNRRA